MIMDDESWNIVRMIRTYISDSLRLYYQPLGHCCKHNNITSHKLISSVIISLTSWCLQIILIFHALFVYDVSSDVLWHIKNWLTTLYQLFSPFHGAMWSFCYLHYFWKFDLEYLNVETISSNISTKYFYFKIWSASKTCFQICRDIMYVSDNDLLMVTFCWQWVFLPDPLVRDKLTLPPKDQVDYRAACFCHRNLIDVGYVCSVCLSSKSTQVLFTTGCQGINLLSYSILRY